MLPQQRQDVILESVRRHGAARVSDLVMQLGVSDMTVRRDIQELARRDLVVRVHGGATALTGSSGYEPGFQLKSALETEAKKAIARAAALLVEPGDSIALSAGTTTYELAKELLTIPDLKVVTNSPPAADLLHAAGRDDLTVILVGGERTPSDALVGPVAVRTLRVLHVDKLFLGVHGIDLRAGLTTPNLLEAETNRAMVGAAQQLVVVCDHSKWSVVGLSSMAELDDIDVLVVDDGIDPHARRELEQQLRRVVIAPTDVAASYAD